ncbi:hypothetical protein BD310DRAFT_309260 [Dichomitus squalens]|uniref:Uncharacterized protein n=1 Tax=Dichomitus squalens TaxID=114155 RepID=A0A4Q9Q1D2_9APHY|nr:hypothetical protein BD310DRAFT_309260 [Dichomitus squalens]
MWRIQPQSRSGDPIYSITGALRLTAFANMWRERQKSVALPFETCSRDWQSCSRRAISLLQSTPFLPSCSTWHFGTYALLVIQEDASSIRAYEIGCDNTTITHECVHHGDGPPGDRLGLRFIVGALREYGPNLLCPELATS